jgi:metal-responsive CopG/Arc/MetJ family transcriptional regulator
MSALTVRLPEKVVSEVDMRAQKLRITRSAYIRKSIENMNEKLRLQERRNKLINASKKVKKESMDVNAEFAEVEDDENL